MRILFLSHDASRTGAPIALLRLLGWLRTNTDHEVHTAFSGAGPLLDDFRELTPVTNLAVEGAVLERVARLKGPRDGIRAFADRRLSRQLARLGDFDLIYSNTVMNGRVLGLLRPAGVPVICHVHELDQWISESVEPSAWEAITAVTTRWIAVSSSVRSNLVERHRIANAAIDTVYPFLDTTDVSLPTSSERAAARDLLGVPRDIRVVGGCGTTDWRKGPDLFVAVAALVRKRIDGPIPCFCWLGAGRAREQARLRYDADAAGLGEHVIFKAPIPDARSAFAAFDVFAMTSREDPYPTVMIENALAGNPIVGFAGSGGAAEFIEHDSGAVVPYLDLEAFADATVRLLEDEALRQRFGETAWQKVRERHDLDSACRQILRAMEKTRAAGGVSGERT